MRRGWSVREWVLVGLFGALWGAAEMTLGSVLHLVFPPLTDPVFVGLIMAAVGCLLALCGRIFVPRRGSVLLIGLITAVLKAFSLGGVKVGPILGILAESALMELGLFVLPEASYGAYALAGSLAVSWNFFHRFVMMGLLYGNDVLEVGLKMAEDGARLLGMRQEIVLAILGLLLALRLAVGAAAGLLARSVGLQIRGRVGSGAAA